MPPKGCALPQDHWAIFIAHYPNRWDYAQQTSVHARSKIDVAHSEIAMPLFQRDRLSEEAQRVAASYRMTNSAPEFEDDTAAQYMERNRPFFQADVAGIVRNLALRDKSA